MGVLVHDAIVCIDELSARFLPDCTCEIGAYILARLLRAMQTVNRTLAMVTTRSD